MKIPKKKKKTTTKNIFFLYQLIKLVHFYSCFLTSLNFKYCLLSPVGFHTWLFEVQLVEI